MSRASAVRCVSCRTTGPVMVTGQHPELVDTGAWSEFMHRHSYHGPVVLVDVNRLANPRLLENDDADALGAAPFVPPRVTEAQSEWIIDGLRDQLTEVRKVMEEQEDPVKRAPLARFATALDSLREDWSKAHKRAWR